MHGKSFRIIASLDVRHRASQDVISGILRFAASHPEWDLQMRDNHPSNDGFAVDSNWEPDGIIIDGICNSRRGARLLAASSLRGAVFVNATPPQSFHPAYASLTTDNGTLAVAAARLLKGHGLRHFAFVGSGGDEPWSAKREACFREALGDAGSDLRCHRSPRRRTSQGWDVEFKALAAWIADLPKPCGIWAAHDQRAKHVLDACRAAGVSVPEQVQVLGVDNESYICEQTIPALSSIEPDFSAGGYAAAEALNAILHGRRLKAKFLTIPMKGVVERLSTTDLSGAGSRVTRACDYIRRHAKEGIAVGAVVRAVGGSERLLEKNFRAVLGHSICRELQNRRMEAAARLLKETPMPIGAIAANAGFRNANYLKNLFRRRFNMSMSAYRRLAGKHRSAP